MTRNLTTLFLGAILILVFGCKSKQQLNTNATTEVATSYYSFLSKEDASKAIITDEMDLFFEKIRPLEISIQMKQADLATKKKELIIDDYKKYLSEDVADFTDSEKLFVKTAMDKMVGEIKKFNKNLLPENIRLIKTTANHYGNSVYYTREDCIVIPIDVLNGNNPEAFYGTMLHEFFHIYSRLNHGVRDQLYNLVGFRNLNTDVTIYPELSNKILFNPDGVDMNFAITLKDEDGKPFEAMPVLSSNSPVFKNTSPAFFSYIDFTLYKIHQVGSSFEIKDASDRLNLVNHPEFFEKITQNTGYIIHPDEILADNFMFLMLIEENAALLKQYQPNGQKLINDIRAILVSAK